VTVELGEEAYEARAVVPDGDERDRLYAIMSAQAPSLRVHEQKTSRQFPIVILEGVPAPTKTVRRGGERTYRRGPALRPRQGLG
jgi:hypothetical protein